jgi:hypothetical protein
MLSTTRNKLYTRVYYSPDDGTCNPHESIDVVVYPFDLAYMLEMQPPNNILAGYGTLHCSVSGCSA